MKFGLDAEQERVKEPIWNFLPGSDDNSDGMINFDGIPRCWCKSAVLGIANRSLTNTAIHSHRSKSKKMLEIRHTIWPQHHSSKVTCWQEWNRAPTIFKH